MYEYCKCNLSERNFLALVAFFSLFRDIKFAISAGLKCNEAEAGGKGPFVMSLAMPHAELLGSCVWRVAA